MIPLISLLVLAPFVLIAAPALAQTPSLKPVVRVASDIVTVGDLVANAGAKSSIAVFRSPDLGKSGTVAVSDILSAVAVHGLRNVDTGALDHVSVTRDSRAVAIEDLRGPLASALTRGLDVEPDALDIVLTGESAAVQFPVEADGAIAVREAMWDRDAGTFSALLAIRRIDGRTERRTITGQAVETETILGIRRDLARGTLLTESDIEQRRVAKSEIESGMLSDIALAAGKEVRRPLREGHTLRANDLTEPTLVKSNSSVTMVFKSGGLTLTASAQALRDGKGGETIPVMNAHTKRVLHAVVTNFNEVTITPPRAIVSAAK